MYSPKDATCTSVQPSQRANQFSFPPTQRSGLLSSPTRSTRSRDQRFNLQRSFDRLLAFLEPAPVS